MNAIQGSIPVSPVNQPIAQKLAYRMVQVNANLDKILQLFSDTAVIVVSPGVEWDKKTFSAKLQKGSIDNITAIGAWTNIFKPAENSSDVIWKVDGNQYRLGLGLDEQGPGWYHIQQTIRLSFVTENEETKISSFNSLEYNKTKIDKDIPGLSSK